MNTYKFLLRLTEDEKEQLYKIQNELSKQIGITISINQTIKILIKEKDNDKKEQ